ncbi:hypothetical protein B0H16DRAFT_737635 [Mycena metata]|uniref:Uncharacterized protein n=1 Tax=Mycena metata TaxID=1033252 RepID=A0AAD7NC98_9AGAR|nr:hypothetical protein B0H16DRAFT_737635 [Mycena metata]
MCVHPNFCPPSPSYPLCHPDHSLPRVSHAVHVYSGGQRRTGPYVRIRERVTRASLHPRPPTPSLIACFRPPSSPSSPVSPSHLQTRTQCGCRMRQVSPRRATSLARGGAAPNLCACTAQCVASNHPMPQVSRHEWAAARRCRLRHKSRIQIRLGACATRHSGCAICVIACGSGTGGLQRTDSFLRACFPVSRDACSTRSHPSLLSALPPGPESPPVPVPLARARFESD